MSSLSPRLQVRVQQKQILTPGLVQMVSLLQLNRLELKDMISAEIAQNPVLEEAADGGEELITGRIAAAARSRAPGDPADQSILEVTSGPPAMAKAREADAAEIAAAAALGDPEPAIDRNRLLTADASRDSRAKADRSVRRNRLRHLFRRVSGPWLQEPGVGERRKAVVRDVPILARHAERSSAFATGAGRADRSRFATRRKRSSAI